MMKVVVYINGHMTHVYICQSGKNSIIYGNMCMAASGMIDPDRSIQQTRENTPATCLDRMY